VRIAAAADLTAAFKEIGPIFEKKTGLHPLFTFGASGLIARQIEQGAPFDLFASANTDFITVLALKGLTLPNTEKPYAVGHIGIFSVKHHPRTLQDLTSPVYQKVAIANPKTAPYGKAAQEALTSAGVWPAVQPRLVFGDNIRQTQQFALSGNADAAIVSASQGIESKSQGNFVPIPDELHNPLVQSLAILKSSANPAGANAFIQFLLGKQGQAIIRKYGFSAPPTTKQNSPSAKRSGL
jgi:molybdate transport system substrate-binding protein